MMAIPTKMNRHMASIRVNGLDEIIVAFGRERNRCLIINTSCDGGQASKAQPFPHICRNRPMVDSIQERQFKLLWEEPTSNLEPLAEVERALLVVEVLHLPHPELGGLLSGGNGLEHFCSKQ